MKTLQNLVGGIWEDSLSDALLDVVNPATEDVVARVPGGCRRDVDRAVAAAARAQPAWAALPVAERVAHISAWADTVAEHADELAGLECREMGKPTGIGRTFIDGAVAGLKARRPRRCRTASRRRSATRTAARRGSCVTRWEPPR